MDTRSKLLAAMAFASLATLPASAQTAPAVNKTWVSSTGADTGSCQLSAPCKTFAYAISETNAGGEIDVKDSGAYGAFSINKAISIVADGVVASVGLGANGYAISIVSGTNAPVTLHGLTVNVHNLTKDGISITNGSTVTLDHDIIQGNHQGITAIDSGTNVVIAHCLISSNTTGIVSSSRAKVYLGDDTITNNATGISIAGATTSDVGTVYSYGNNEVNANGVSDVNGGTLTSVALR